MAAPEVPGFDALPWQLQYLISIAVGLGVTIASARRYVSSRNKPAETQEMVVQSASIVDSKPLFDLVQVGKDQLVELREIRRVSDLTLQHLHEIEREREEDRRVERRVKEELLTSAQKLKQRRVTRDDD